MVDYGRPLEFGANADPLASDPAAAARVARLADDAGLDLVGMQDHPYVDRFLDTWTVLATLAAQTQRVRLFTNVANLPLRPPAMLAKAAATLDILSGGRFELGLGAGAFWEGIRAMGGPDRRPSEAVEALEEAIRLIRLFWTGQRGVRFIGRYYALHGAQTGPRPPHAIGIWLGALGPRMLALTGRLADGVSWSRPYVPPSQLDTMHARIDEAARQAGRSPREIRRLYNLMGLIGPSRGEQPLAGPKEFWVDELTRLAVDHGMDTFVFWPLEDHLRQIETFARDVAPAVRAAVASERREA